MAGGANAYAYVGNNPLGYSDPQGLSSWGVVVTVIRAVRILWSMFELAMMTHDDELLEPVQDLLKIKAIKAKATIPKEDCKERSQFFHSLLQSVL